MKKITLLLILLISISGFSQKAPISKEVVDWYLACSEDQSLPQIVYDAKQKAYYAKNSSGSYLLVENPNDISVPGHPFFRVLVININRYTSSVKISTTNHFYKSEPSAITNQLIAGGGDLSTALITEAAAFTESDSLHEKFKKFIGDVNNLRFQESQVYSECFDPNDLECCKQDIPNSYQTLSEVYLTLQLEIKRSIEDAKGSARKELEYMQSVLESIKAEELFRLVRFVNTLSRNNFYYLSPPIYPEGEKITINVSVSKNDHDRTGELVQYSHDEDLAPLKIRVRNKWLFSFSSGLFIGFSENFKNPVYGWKSLMDAEGEVTGYNLIETGIEKEPFGLAGFANMTTKFNNFLGGGLTIGAGVTLEETPKLTYLAGLTLCLGDQKQLNITGGVAFIRTNQLNTRLYSGDETVVYDQKIDPIYYKVFKGGLFFALSYTIFDVSKSEESGE